MSTQYRAESTTWQINISPLANQNKDMSFQVILETANPPRQTRQTGISWHRFSSVSQSNQLYHSIPWTYSRRKRTPTSLFFEIKHKLISHLHVHNLHQLNNQYASTKELYWRTSHQPMGLFTFQLQMCWGSTLLKEASQQQVIPNHQDGSVPVLNAKQSAIQNKNVCERH